APEAMQLLADGIVLQRKIRDQCYGTNLGKFFVDLTSVDAGAEINLAGQTPVSCKIHQHGVAFGTRFFHRSLAPRFPFETFTARSGIGTNARDEDQADHSSESAASS